MCSSIEVSFIDLYNISYKFSKFFNSTFNDCNHLMVNPRPKGCLYEKKHPTYSLVNRMSRFAGMIFVFIYMRSFVLLCRDEFVTRYFLSLVQFDFSYSSAIITLNLAFILGSSGTKSNFIKTIRDL